MKKSALSLVALVLLSASSLPASAQSPSAGSNAKHQWVGGCNPRPQGVLGSVYAMVVSFFGF